MQPIINEWQLGDRLGKALQHQQRADFALWLAFLSPAVEEMAEFQTPVNQAAQPKHDLYQQLAVSKRRSFAYQTTDDQTLLQQSQAAQQGLAQLKLYSYLQEQPWVWQEDKRKLEPQVFADLDLHCRRRLAGDNMAPSVSDETALYEILEQLSATQV